MERDQSEPLIALIHEARALIPNEMSDIDWAPP